MSLLGQIRARFTFADNKAAGFGRAKGSGFGRGQGGSYRGLVNEMTGLGTGRDKGTTSYWSWEKLHKEELEKAYRSNWIARKVVDIPAMDMLRGGWHWQASPEATKQLEAECRRLNLAQKVLEALKWARLYGGCGLYISDGAEDVSEPLSLERIGLGGIEFVTVLPYYFLKASQLDLDPISPNFGEPLSYTIASASQNLAYVHGSRVVRFLGHETPVASQHYKDYWGDSVLECVDQTIRDYTAGQQGIANLIQEASLDIIGVDGLMENIVDLDYQNALVERTRLAMDTKSTLNALIKDNQDSYSQKTANFGGLPEVLRLLLQIVSGAADIPATRLLGQSPDGMNATGEGDIRNYYDRIEAERSLKLIPPLTRLMEAVIRSALGDRPDDVSFHFDPLWQMNAKDAAEVEKRKAETISAYAMSGTVPEGVLTEMSRGAIVSAGEAWPGVKEAYERYCDGEGVLIGAGEGEDAA